MLRFSVNFKECIHWTSLFYWLITIKSIKRHVLNCTFLSITMAPQTFSFLVIGAMISVVTKDSRAVILECFLHTAFIIIHWCALLCQYILSWSCDSVCLPPLHGHRRVSSAPSLAWFATIASASAFGCPQFLWTHHQLPRISLRLSFPVTFHWPQNKIPLLTNDLPGLLWPAFFLIV